MYSPGGIAYPELGDCEPFPLGDELHLFHLTIPNRDVVQHAVSHDGLSWRALPSAIHTGDPGACDDDAIQTMSVTERDGTYYMLYSAAARAEGGQVQRSALATSTDLIHWTKVPDNPVGEADARWYEADLSTTGTVSWRDPKPILVGDMYYATVCARERSGPLARRGCVGVLASKDLRTWGSRPPLFAPRRHWELECPQVFEIEGTYYLTAAVIPERIQRYWVAPRFEGPYEIPADGGLLAPKGHYAGRICRWKGLDLLVCWHKSWHKPDYDWPAIRNPAGKFAVAPLVVSRRSDNSLAQRSYPGWSTYRTGSLTALSPASSLDSSEPAAGEWRVDAGPGMALLASAHDVADAWVEAVLTIDARMGGLTFRLDDQSGGYYIELANGSREIVLYKYLPRNTPTGHVRYSYTEIQRGCLMQPVSSGTSMALRLLMVGPYIECSFDEQVVLATLSGERTSGRVGVWAESGAAHAEIVWAPMRAPAHM